MINILVQSLYGRISNTSSYLQKIIYKDRKQRNENLVPKKLFRQQPVVIVCWKVVEISECDHSSALVDLYSITVCIAPTAIRDRKIIGVPCRDLNRGCSTVDYSHKPVVSNIMPKYPTGRLDVAQVEYDT